MLDHPDDDYDSGGSGGAGSNCGNNSFSIRYRDILSDEDDEDDLGMYEDDDDDNLMMNDDPIREDLLEEVFCADIANIGDADDSSPSPSSSTGSGDANRQRRVGEDPSSSSTEPQKKLPWWFRSQMMREDSADSRNRSKSKLNSDDTNIDGSNNEGRGGGERRGSSASSAGTSSSGPKSGGRRRMQRRRSLERDDSLRRKFERRRRLSKVVGERTTNDRSHEQERRRRGSYHEADQDHQAAEVEKPGDDAAARGEGGTKRVVRRLSGMLCAGGGGGDGSYDPLNKQASSLSDDFPDDLSSRLAAEERRKDLSKESSGLMTASTVGLEHESSDDAVWRSISGRKLRGRSWSSSRRCGGGLIAAKLGVRRERLLVVTLMLIMALVACMGAVAVYQRREARVESPLGDVEVAPSDRGEGPTTDDQARDDTFPVVAPRNDPAGENGMTEQDLISTMKERGPPPKALLSLLSSISGSASLIGDPNSPSHRAMQWLLYEDADEWQRLSWDYATDGGGGPMGSDVRARIEQRFALAAVYFANVATGDVTLRGWMTGEHECDWEGVGCGEFGSDPRAGGVRVVTDLDLSRSGLRGPIPDELRALTRLEHLMLQENDLTGSIPSWINELESLDSLYLSNNMLSGRIPEELALLPSLEELWIEGNSLSGAAPQAMCQRVHILVADCLGERPRVECTCCSSCFP